MNYLLSLGGLWCVAYWSLTVFTSFFTERRVNVLSFVYVLYFPIAWLRAIFWLIGISVYKVLPVPPGTVMSIIRLLREEIEEIFWRYDIFSRIVFGFFSIVLFKEETLLFMFIWKSCIFLHVSYFFYLKLICFHRFNWRLLLKQN